VPEPEVHILLVVGQQGRRLRIGGVQLLVVVEVELEGVEACGRVALEGEQVADPRRRQALQISRAGSLVFLLRCACCRPAVISAITLNGLLMVLIALQQTVSNRGYALS
jgi:hypothetical protein